MLQYKWKLKTLYQVEKYKGACYEVQLCEMTRIRKSTGRENRLEIARLMGKIWSDL